MLHAGEEFRGVTGGNGRAEDLGLGRDRAARQARIAAVERVVDLSRTRAKAGGTIRFAQRGGRDELPVDPCDAFLDPLFHPADFLLVAVAHEIVRVDPSPENWPATEI